MDNKQKEQMKKGLVFGGLGLLFALSMWFIFAPSGKDKTAAEQGLNDSIPQATTEKLTENKLKAYELGDKAHEEEQTREEMGRLSDYFAQNTAPSEEQRAETAASTAKIENSMHRYEENNRLLNSFYAPDPHEQEREALRSEIDNLKKELSAKDSREDNEEKRQLALMEKSYQMAAKYLPKASTPPTFNNGLAAGNEKTEDTAGGSDAAKGKTMQKEKPAMEVLPERRQIVSSLDQPMSDVYFMEEYGKKARNMGFHSLASTVAPTMRNTLKVVVDRTTVLKEGDNVVLRLLESAKVQGLHIPRQSRLIAVAKIEGNRMHLLIKSIEVDGHIIAVKLSAYDMDGQEGVYIPGSEDINALKEVGANIGGSMGTSFTFASSAKDQIISEAARGVMQGASQLLQKKLRTIKVTLKGGYRLFLVQSK